MTSALVLAVALTLSPGTAPEAYQTPACGQWSSWRVPPDHIDVFRIHRKGSSVPARVERWSFPRYVAAVMASGAWPSRPVESAKVGALMIKNWAMWMVRHHQPGYSWRGQCYDIRDGDQFLRPGIRPWSHLPARTMRAVRAIWGVSITKNGHHLRLGWSGGGGSCDAWHDGYHAQEDQVRDCAHRGMGWRAILRHLLGPRLRVTP